MPRAPQPAPPTHEGLPEFAQPKLVLRDDGYVLWIPGRPAPQCRHRTFQVHGITREVSRPRGSRAYAWAEQMKWALAQLGARRCADASSRVPRGAFTLDLVFALHPIARLKSAEWYPKIGDNDNYAKLAQDILCQAGMFGGQDDRVVVDLRVRKVRDPRMTGVRIEVRGLDALPDPSEGLT